MPIPSLRPTNGQASQLKVLRAPEALESRSVPFGMNGHDYVIVGPTATTHVDGSLFKIKAKKEGRPLFYYLVPVRLSL